MLAKIKYFEEYDKRSNISGPLSNVATIDEISIVRNLSKLIFERYESLSAANTARSTTFEIADYANLGVVIADLYTYEDLSLLRIEYSDKFANITITDFTGYQLVTVTSEDALVIDQVYIIKNDIGIAATEPIVYDVVSDTFDISEKLISIECDIFKHDTDYAINLPFSYFTNTAGTDILSLSFDTNGADIEYCAFDGTDPDGEVITGNIDAFSLTNGRAFTIDEQAFLDSQHVYVAVTKNAITDYYKLVKNVEYDLQPVLTTLKQELSDLYVHIFFSKYAIRVNNLTASDIIRLSSCIDENVFVNDLIANDISYYVINSTFGNYYIDLVDIEKTEQINTLSTYSAYNVMYDDAGDFGFTASDVENFGKVIAAMLYDVIKDNTNYVNAAQYLKNLAEIETNTYLQATCIQSDLKTAYLNEIANSYFILSILNKRQLRWILGRLQYAKSQIDAGFLLYDISNTTLENSISALSYLLNINTYSGWAYIESSIYNFFNELHLLKYKANVVQRISF